MFHCGLRYRFRDVVGVVALFLGGGGAFLAGRGGIRCVMLRLRANTNDGGAAAAAGCRRCYTRRTVLVLHFPSPHASPVPARGSCVRTGGHRGRYIAVAQ